MFNINRRHFLKYVGCGTAGAMTIHGIGAHAKEQNPESQPTPIKVKLEKISLKNTYRAAAIGSTGHGNFGHGLDRMFTNLPGVEFVALADDDPEGLVKAGQRNGVKKLYKDYNEMLRKEKIDLVSVAMRHSEMHEKIVIDCAKAGKHIFCEKPIAPDLAAADRMVAACRQAGVKTTVSVQNRISPAVRKALEMVKNGDIGQILSMRGRGKEDRRGGGEDLIVLGFHILDLMTLFAGKPQWAFAHVMQDGRDMVKEDAHAGREPNGLVAGDWMSAMYGFPNGVHGFFESHKGLKNPTDRFNLEIHGSEGIIALRSLKDVVWFQGPVLNPAKPHQWIPVTSPEWEAVEDKMHWCNQLLVLDLLKAVEEDRQTMASIEDLRWSLEMISSVYAAHFAKGRVDLPLGERIHPLT